MISAPLQHHQHAQTRSKFEGSLVCCLRDPGFIVNPAAIVIEHGLGRANAPWRVHALAHAVLDEFNLIQRYGFRVLGSGRRVNKRRFNDRHIVVQHIQFSQPSCVEELEIRRPASN